MTQLLSVNVGLPRDIAWRGKIVHTGIWKTPVEGRAVVRRLNIDGDGQGDLGGHGGEQRAVLVYQIESYQYWQERLGRHDFVHGQFGENFTVQGLPDDEVCIGDRYRIGTALFEVTQPRTTCYRVGIRLDQPQMASLLTASGRPGFYLRVLEEGDIGAGDQIHQVAKGPEPMTVAEVNALLYSSPHPRGQLERALRMPALSPGWRWSFEALLRREQTAPGSTGNAGLVPAEASVAAAPGFRPLRVARIVRESSDVISLSLRAIDARPLTPSQPGQFVVLRMRTRGDAAPLFRSYSLSGPVSAQEYRISVKVEPHGAAGTYLASSVKEGDVLDVSEPRGSFLLHSGAGPVVLLSAGIGATPVLAMLHSLATGSYPGEVWWLHGARDGRSHCFAAEARVLTARLAHGHSHVRYSRPAAEDRLGTNYDAAGHIDVNAMTHLGVPRGADFYICGPAPFLRDISIGLAASGVAQDRIHSEKFSGYQALTPGVVEGASREPHQPEGSAGAGPLITFARSGLSVRWRTDREQNLLELAEACDVPVRWSCRTGVCHNCESGLISGAVAYDPQPLDPPAEGNVLICCSRPRDDVVIDL